MPAALWALLGVAAGAGLAIQGPINAALARGLGFPLAAAAISFASGAIILAVLAFATAQMEGVTIAWRAPPPWAYVAGGCLGATYVMSAILLTPRIGATAFIVLTVAGQLITGLLIDRVGFLGIPIHAATPGRLAGAALLVAGAVMVRLF